MVDDTGYKEIFEAFYAHANAEKAEGMCAYMRNLFPYLGIPTPLRRQLSKEFLKTARKAKVVDWDFINTCWQQDKREFQYLAIDYLNVVLPLLCPKDIPKLKKLAVSKSWWDTIDGLDRIVGDTALRHPEVNKTLLTWSVHDNFWLRRIAIDHQLMRKDKTDTALLEEIILNNLGQKEFFINKAIGWSLREYSKTNPSWVRSFIDLHKGQMAPLSLREGSKYL